MAIKIRASELGCGAPYRLTYSGQVFGSFEIRAFLADYVQAYRASVRKVVSYFTEVIGRGGVDELTAYILIGPSNVPPHVGDSDAWGAIMGKGSDYETLKKGSDLKLVYEIARYGDETKIGAYLGEYLKRFGLGIGDLTHEKVETLFGVFPRTGARSAVASAAFRIQRSYLSSVESARRTSHDRRVAFANAMHRNPTFYEPFYRFCNHLGSWNHGCRFYNQIRQELRDQGHKQALINCSQKIVMDRHRDIPAWKGTYAVGDEERETGSQAPNILAVFEQQLPSPDEVEEDIFRRYGKLGPPIALAKDTHFIRTVLCLLNDAEALFTADEEKEELVNTIKKRGKVSYHHGWDTMCRQVEANKRAADPRFRRAVEFVTGELRDFITSCRVVRTPSLKDGLAAWPHVPQDKYGWKFAEVDGATRGNEVAVSIRLPAFRSPNGALNRPRTAHVIIRGNLPIAKSHVLDEQLDILNPTQFRPDRLSVRNSDFGMGTQKTYLKAQALRLLLEGEKIIAQICVENITEARRDPIAIKNLAGNVEAGERVAILHYLPGGCRLGTMAVFEKTGEAASAVGWKLIRFRERVGTGHQRHIAEETFLILEEDEFNFVVSNLTSHYRSAHPTDNAKNMRKIGETVRHLADTRYKQIASRIARICQDNGIGYLFVGGGGRLISRGGVSHPVNRFFTLSKTNGRATATGFLVNAAMKSGLTIQYGSAKPAFISSKDTVVTGRIPAQMHLVSSFHQPKKPEFGYNLGSIVASKGRRDRLYDSFTEFTSSFVLNASWSLLLYHFNKEFRARADQLLDSFERQMLIENETFGAGFRAM